LVIYYYKVSYQSFFTTGDDMKISKMLFLLILLALSTEVMAQQLQVAEMAFATSMDERLPVDTDTSFSAEVGTIFCFTRITGATDTSEVTHEWYFKDEEKARIDLSVASNDWRTWSSKTILESWKGSWRVMVVDADGEVLATKNFVITDN
jgi:hypothetical protein